MSSKSYWEKREAEQLKHYITNEKEYDKEIKRIYQKQLDSIQSEINSFYGKFASKEGITIAEAKKRVSKLDIAAYERKAKQYVEEKNFSAKANEEMRLYNATMRINRLELLKANIGLEMIAGHDELDKFMSGILKGRTEEELKRQAGILGKTIKNNAQKADAIVNASFHNAKFSDRIWMYQELLKNELNSLLQSGMIQGKNPIVLAKELQKMYNVSVNNAERLMRTELARVQTEAQKQSFERNGFEEYTFIANSGCCDICQSLNGKHFKVSKMMPGENAAPMHPHCRCSVAAYENSEEYEAWIDYLDKGGSTKEWNKFLETIEKLPNIKNKNVKSGVESFTNTLKTSKGIEKHVNNMEMYNEFTEYKYDSSLPAAFAYDPQQDVILYNSKHKDFNDLDKTFAVAHELTHRIDRLEYRSWENDKFIKAIEETRKNVMKNKSKIESWFDFNGKYEFEDGLQDIISALSKNEIRTWTGHESKYWENPNNIAKEIFANISAIDILDTAAKEEFSGLLKPIFEAYRGIVE